ncbi:MAG: DNA polymerase III subunit delta [Bacteroidaceae bacterium]|nr:DNA polymerase III subunit delta [Bacteroidaceae bacterium]
MKFQDIIGQEEVICQLVQQVNQGRLPHALMLCGPAGSGKLAIALALARYMLCEHPVEGEPCGQCHACLMTEGWAHPDLHFSFPLVKTKSTDQPVSDDRLTEWREQLSRTPYFTANDWLADLKGENQQLQFYVSESDALQHKLSIKSSQGGYRVVIVWLPEKMPPATANKLLKLIEEPPSKTHFLMVCQEPDQVLGTILSRTQRILVPALSEETIAKALSERHDLPQEKAQNLAHIAQGSYTQALQLVQEDNDRKEYFDLFVELMRLCYMRKAKDMRQWADRVAALGRERQKNMLEYCQRLVRENFIYNFRHKELNYMTEEENQFAEKFARFINERNVIPLMEELTACQTDIEQNVNAKMVFFDLTLKITLLLK